MIRKYLLKMYGLLCKLIKQFAVVDDSKHDLYCRIAL